MVKEATHGLTLFQAVKAGVLEHTDTSIKPPLWGGDTTGDDPVQIRWQSAIESARLSSTPGTQPQPKRPAQEAGLPDNSLGAFWLTAPQRARPHWRDRLASAPSEQGVSQLPLVSQMPSADATKQPPKVIRPWHHIWADLQDLALDRSHRYLAWQVLHATLPCGALKAYRAISRSYPQEQHDRLLGEADCPNCPGVVESIFHQLYLCPLAKRVWDWVIRVWEEVSGQPVLDLGPCELLLGRGGPFRPQKSQGLGVAATIIGHAARLLANNQISNTISAAIQPAGSMAHAARPIEAASVDRCGVCHQARHDERACFA